MQLYLDDDSVDSALIRLLTAAGHDVLIPAAAGTAGQEDVIHLMRSIQTNRSLLTRNYDDFKLLHDLVLSSGGRRPGIMVVRRDNDPSREMSNRAVVQAVAEVSHSGATFRYSFYILNHWRGQNLRQILRFRARPHDDWAIR